MHFLFLITNLWADTSADYIEKEVASVRMLSEDMLDVGSFWTYTPAEIGKGLNTEMFYLFNNKFITHIDRKSELHDSHRKNMRDFVDHILEDNLVHSCAVSYSYFIFYKEELRKDFFVENANNIEGDMIHYQAKNSTINFYLINGEKDIDSKKLSNFYTKTCKPFEY